MEDYGLPRDIIVPAKLAVQPTLQEKVNSSPGSFVKLKGRENPLNVFKENVVMNKTKWRVDPLAAGRE